MAVGTVSSAVIAFVSGALYESGCVFWVHFSEKGKPLTTSLFSMAVAAAGVAGIGESIHNLPVATCYVLGYGVGTYCAVWGKKRFRK